MSAMGQKQTYAAQHCMSGLGQKQTIAVQTGMSALLPISDIDCAVPLLALLASRWRAHSALRICRYHRRRGVLGACVKWTGSLARVLRGPFHLWTAILPSNPSNCRAILIF